MYKKERFFLAFLLFFILSLFIFVIGKTSFGENITGLIEEAIMPLQKGSFLFFSSFENQFADKKIQKLQEENITLRKKIVDQSFLQKENNALKDQFKTTYPKPYNLLPASVIGNPGFIPGVTFSKQIIIDKGEKDGVLEGQAVVVENVILGKIIKTSLHFSIVLPVSDVNSSFSGLNARTNALGVVKGQGEGEMILENVILSDELKDGDTVITKGEIDKKGIGYPPNLIVGKIMSIDKKASSLFQSAKIKSPLDMNKLSTVFVVLGL